MKKMLIVVLAAVVLPAMLALGGGSGAVITKSFTNYVELTQATVSEWLGAVMVTIPNGGGNNMDICLTIGTTKHLLMRSSTTNFTTALWVSDFGPVQWNPGYVLSVTNSSASNAVLTVFPVTQP